MKIFRNPEFNRIFVLYSLLSAAACIFAFVWEVHFGCLMAFMCVIFLSGFYVSTYNRYKRISELAADINKILHEDKFIPFNKYSEGELAILQSEIHKMTVRLREQQQNLLDDKIYLADSLADISHQIRTPLTSINLLVNFLADPDITDERRQKTSRELYGMLSRIDWLITVLLKISRLDAGTVQFKKEKITFEELIRKSVSSVLVSMELREQTLNINTAGDFAGDVSWTCEAVTNIVKNCMEHTPDGGTINISAAENSLFGEIIITDNGCGIMPQDLPHIFERFYKGGNSDKNSFGIGLALAKKIIAVQNGTIKAENNIQGGAKFTIRFYKGTV